MVEDGLTLSSNFTALPDAYRLHVVVSDVASQSVGSLIIPLRITRHGGTETRSSLRRCFVSLRLVPPCSTYQSNFTPNLAMRGPRTVVAFSNAGARAPVDVHGGVGVHRVEQVEEQPELRAIGGEAQLLLDAEVDHRHGVLAARADRLGQDDLRAVVQLADARLEEAAVGRAALHLQHRRHAQAPAGVDRAGDLGVPVGVLVLGLLVRVRRDSCRTARSSAPPCRSGC